MSISKEVLTEAAYQITGGNMKNLSIDQIERLMTITQHVTDLCLNELERRGAIVMVSGAPVVPYVCDHMVETILTRPG